MNKKQLNDITIGFDGNVSESGEPKVGDNFELNGFDVTIGSVAFGQAMLIVKSDDNLRQAGSTGLDAIDFPETIDVLGLSFSLPANADKNTILANAGFSGSYWTSVRKGRGNSEGLVATIGESGTEQVSNSQLNQVFAFATASLDKLKSDAPFYNLYVEPTILEPFPSKPITEKPITTKPSVNDDVFTSEDALGDDADVFTNDDPTIVVDSADTWNNSTSWSDNLTEMIEDESIEDFFEDNLGVDVVEVTLDSGINNTNQDEELTTEPTTTTTQEEEDEEPTLDLGGDSKYLYLIGLGILVLVLALRKK